MDAPTLQAFESRLLATRAELQGLESVAQEALRAVELDQTRQGRLSRIDALQDQAMAQEAARRRELELRKISAALGRIDSGEFGYCVACGEEIKRERLDADPSTALCIACANAREGR